MKTIAKPTLETVIKEDGIKFVPINGEMVVYKIVKKEKGVLKNIMRSFNGSMKLTTDHWYKAQKRVGRDAGRNDKVSSWYCTGIHCVKEYKDAVAYLKNFRKPEERVIYKCLVKGEQWQKPTNNKVMLVSDLKFIEEIK